MIFHEREQDLLMLLLKDKMTDGLIVPMEWMNGINKEQDYTDVSRCLDRRDVSSRHFRNLREYPESSGDSKSRCFELPFIISTFEFCFSTEGRFLREASS